MAETKKKRGRPPKARQGHLPGLEPPSIKEIDNAAERYVDRRNDRMEMLQDEIKARDVLEAAMKKHELRVYEYDGKTVELCMEEKVKVRKKKESSDADSAD